MNEENKANETKMVTCEVEPSITNGGLEALSVEKETRKKKKNSKSVSITVRLYPEQDKMLRDALKKTGYSITAAVGNALQFWIENFVDTNFNSDSLVGKEKWGE